MTGEQVGQVGQADEAIAAGTEGTALVATSTGELAAGLETTGTIGAAGEETTGAGTALVAT